MSVGSSDLSHEAMAISVGTRDRRVKMRSPSKGKLLLGGAIGLVAVAIAVGVMRPKPAPGIGAGSPPEVAVAQVEQKDIPIYGEWIGTLDGFVNADVRGQVTGYLLRQ